MKDEKAMNFKNLLKYLEYVFEYGAPDDIKLVTSYLNIQQFSQEELTQYLIKTIPMYRSRKQFSQIDQALRQFVENSKNKSLSGN